MAQEAQPLFNFYFRYRWSHQDFTEWQDGMMGLNRSVFEGLLGAVVSNGFDVAPVSGMLLQVEPGIALGPSGYVMVENDTNQFSFSAPGSNVRKDLIVARPLLVDDTEITRPTSPFDSVYLKQLQDCEVVVIEGTAAAEPAYPAVEDNDVILAGVRIAAGASSISQDDIDFEVKDFHGKNSELQEHFGKNDSRLQPYRSTKNVMGIKPSQLEHPQPRGFSFVGQAPSIFPKDASQDYAHEDTLLNFETGVISGGDEQSADFTPTIPTAGNAIVASVQLDANDELQITYGTQGTRAQCLAGIRNQEASGAGSVAYAPGTKLIGFVVAYSGDGVGIDDLDVLDARSWGSAGSTGGSSNPGVAGGTVRSLIAADFPYALTLLNNGDVLNVDGSAAAAIMDIELPAPTANWKITVKDTKGQFASNFAARFVRNGSEEIEGLAADYDLQADFGQWTIYSDGTDYFLM